MIDEDAERCLELEEKIKALASKIKEVAKESRDRQDFIIDSRLWTGVHFGVSGRVSAQWSASARKEV